MNKITFRKLLFSAALYSLGTSSFAQTYEIDAEDGNTITTCSGTFTDSNPSTTGNYLDNEDYTVTFCSGSGDFLTFDFDVTGFFDPLGTGDTLYMYDGTSVAGDLIMKIDNTDDPAFSQFMLSTFSTCVTFRFVSNGDGNTNDGWAAEISCPAPPAPCNNNTVAADIQLQAPYICNLDGYCGNTSSYYHEDLPNNMVSGGNCPSTQAFLGTIENNSWLAFEATTTSVSLDFTVSGCGTDGIQVGILQFNGSDWVRYSPCAMTDGANTGSFTVTGTGLTVGETYYLMMDGNAGANCDYQINVSGGSGVAIVDAGADQTICGGNVNLTATGPGSAVYTWHSLDGVVVGAVGANQTFSPLVTTTYVVEVTGGGVCENQTDTVVVTVGSGAVNPGTNGAITFCNTDAATDLFNSLGGTPDAGGVWSPALTSGTGVFDPAVDGANTYTYTVTNACGSASAEVVVSVDNGLANTGVDGSLTLCVGDPVTDLFNELTATPDLGGLWSPVMISGTGVFDPGVDAANTYTYSITNTCGTASSDVIVSVVTSPDAGTNGTATFCENDPVDDLFNYLIGSPDGGGTWNPALTSGTGVFDPANDLGGTYTYTITTSCGMATSEVDVIVNQLPNTGTNSNVTFCPADPSTDLITYLGGSPETGGTWLPALISGTGDFDPSQDPAGTYTYTVSNSCGSSSSTVDVMITAPTNSGNDNSITICDSQTSFNLSDSLAGTPDAGGSWSPVLTSGNDLFDPAQDPAGIYTYTVTNSCGTSSSNLTVNISSAPSVGLGNVYVTCPSSDPIDLLSVINGSPEVGGVWSPVLTSGTNVFDPQLDPMVDYVYTVSNECGSSSTDLTITSDGVDCDQHIFVPNVFSPDGNGENDELFVRGKGIDFFNFYLYNRWGQLIFETSSLDVGWDGSFGGKPVNAGVFVYVLKGKFANGEEIDLKGNVTLVK